MNSLPSDFLTTAVNYGDVIYRKSVSAFNGFNKSVSAQIVVKVDPDGVIKPGNAEYAGSVPGKIQFFTANDDGKLNNVGEFDKAGRLVTKEHWSVTSNPSGNPLLLMLNSDDPGSGATLSLRRSRGNYNLPVTVKKNDSIFKISWYAHDGQSYKETSSIHSTIVDEVSLGVLPASISFKTFDYSTGTPTDSLKINPDKSVSLTSISSLTGGGVQFNSPVCLPRVENQHARDSNILEPVAGMLIFIVELDTVQVYTAQGWRSLF